MSKEQKKIESEDFVFDLVKLEKCGEILGEAWYRLSQVRYINPMKVLEDKELAQKVIQAIDLVQMFISAMEDELEEIDDNYSYTAR